MTDRLSFVADSCAPLAGAVNETCVWRAGGDELAPYAEMVVAYGRLTRLHLAAQPHGDTRPAVMDHPLERLRQAQTGEIRLRVLDIADRLHGELTH